MFFTIKNKNQIIHLSYKSKLIDLIKKSRYAMYKIDARIKGVNTFLNKHVSHRARMNFLDHQCLVDGELYRREYLDMMIWVDFNEVQRSINNNPILIGIQRSMTLASFT